jgi:hypothetical protein
MVSAAILDGPYSDTRREGDAWCHQGARRGCVVPSRAMGMRGATKDRIGDACCHQGSYRSRGCPESPHVVMRLPPPRWRCRPARPPTPRNPALRDAPPRPFPTPPIPRRPPLPTRLPPRDASIPTPVAPTKTADSNPDADHTLLPQCGAFKRTWYERSIRTCQAGLTALSDSRGAPSVVGRSRRRVVAQTVDARGLQSREDAGSTPADALATHPIGADSVEDLSTRHGDMPAGVAAGG